MQGLGQRNKAGIVWVGNQKKNQKRQNKQVEAGNGRQTNCLGTERLDWAEQVAGGARR